MNGVNRVFMNIPISFVKYFKVGITLIILVSAGGLLINQMLIENDPWELSSVSETNKRNTNAIDRHFSKAVAHMQHRQYQQAVAEWHKIMLMNPNIPEVQVNMGFSLFELGQYETAREFFVEAMDRQAFQANAYYGLAIVSEKLGDIEGAMGAMRSYIHLADDDETFIRKARSALWEWESQLASVKKTPIKEKSENSQ